jgi:hypothetical protein
VGACILAKQYRIINTLAKKKIEFLMLRAGEKEKNKATRWINKMLK